MMYAIFYTDPETKKRYACTSSGHRNFYFFPTDPALFAQAKNAEKAIRDWKKLDKEYVASGRIVRKFLLVLDDAVTYSGRVKNMLEIDPDYDNISVVPVRFEYDFPE